MKIKFSEEVKQWYKKAHVWLAGASVALMTGWEAIPEGIRLEASDWLRSTMTTSLVVLAVVVSFLKTLPDEDKDGIPDILEGEE